MLLILVRIGASGNVKEGRVVLAVKFVLARIAVTMHVTVEELDNGLVWLLNELLNELLSELFNEVLNELLNEV